MGSTSTELCRMNVEWGNLMLDGETEHKGGPQQTRVYLHIASPHGDGDCIALRSEHLNKLKEEIQAAIEWVNAEEQEALQREKGLYDDE